MKKCLNLVLSLAMMFSVVNVPMSIQAETDLSANLKAHYTFDNDTSTTIDNVASSETTYDGTLIGSGVSLVEAESGKALKFDATMDSYMEVANMVNASTDSFSISLWFNYDSDLVANGKSTILLQQNGSGRSLLFLENAGTLGTYINATNVRTTKTVRNDTWEHATITYDHTTRQFSFYVNGELESTQDAGSNVVNATTSLLVGRHKNGGTDPKSMKGMIDEIRFYSEVVDAEKAKAIYDDKASSFVPEPTDPSMPVVTIDGNNVIQEIDGSIFGINHRYAFNGYGTYDQENEMMKEDFTKLYRDAAFGSIRYPGGTISNLFNWKTTLGPQEERKDQIHGFYNYSGQGGIASNFGIGEIATFAQENGSEIVYVYSIGRGNAKDAADLIEYLNAAVGTNPNGGIDWAKVRSDNGHPEPYNVRYFEIGNEMQQGGTDGSGSQQYWLPNVGNAEDGYISGGLATFTKQYAVREEDWNVTESYSDGTPSQEFWMRYANAENEDDPDFVAYVEGSVHVYVNNEEWTIVNDLASAAADAKVCYVEPNTGKIIFGDGTHGMIPTKGHQVSVSYQVQRDGFAQISQAMRETTEAINDAEGSDRKVYVYSSYETNGFINKMHTLGYDDLYDGLTIHPYSGTPSGGSSSEANKLVFYNDAINRANNKINDVKNYVNNMRQYDETKVPVISEFGIFRSTDALVRAQAHALYIARSMMGYVEQGSPYIQKHCLVDWFSSGADALGPTQQAVIQAVAQDGADTKLGTGEFDFFATPSAHVFEIYNTAFDGTHVLATTVANAPVNTNNVSTFYALTSKDDRGNLYLAVVNFGGEEVEFKVDAQGYETAGAEMTITKISAEDFDVENSLENPNNVSVKRIGSFVSEENTISVDPYSFSVIKVISGDVNYDKLNAYKEYVASLDLTKYSDASVQQLNETVELVNQMMSSGFVSQSMVDDSYERLRDARNALEPLIATTALEKVIDKASEAELDLYTTTSVEALQAKLQAAQAIVDSPKDYTQEQCDQARSELQAAYDALDLKVGDTTELEALIAEAEALNASFYVEAGYVAMQTELANAKAVLEAEEKPQSAIDAAYNALNEKVQALVFKPVDANNLINKAANSGVSAIDQTSQYSGQTSANTLDYQNGTHWHSDWSDDTQSLPQYITYNLGKAYDLTDITFLPRQDNSYNGDALEIEVYAGASQDAMEYVGTYAFARNGNQLADRTVFKQMKMDAKNVQYVKVVVTKSGADSQQNKFASLAEVRFYGSEVVVVEQANKEELAAAIAAAENMLLEADKYTDGSVIALQGTLDYAKEVYNDPKADQGEVDALVSNLESLMNSMVEKLTTPNKVENLVATDTNYKTITLTWDASEKATSYDVYRKSYKEDAVFEFEATVEEPTYEATGVMTGKEYSFYVVAKNDAGEAEASEEVAMATTLKGTVTLEMEQVSTSKFHLSWNKVDGATRYIVYRKRNDDKMKKVLTLGGDVLEYTTAEMPNGEYEFQVKAGRYDSKDRVMTGASNKVSGTVEALKPTVTVTAGTKSAKISWKKMEGVTHYQVYRATSSTGKYTKLTTTKELSYTAKSLTKGKKYYFKVRGYKTYKSGTDIQYTVYTPYSSVKAVTAK